LHPGALGRNSPGGKTDTAQFLPFPAKDNLSWYFGFVQSRHPGFGRRMKSYVSLKNCQGKEQKL